MHLLAIERAAVRNEPWPFSFAEGAPARQRMVRTRKAALAQRGVLDRPASRTDSLADFFRAPCSLVGGHMDRRDRAVLLLECNTVRQPFVEFRKRLKSQQMLDILASP
jgi:hypothetical protein